MRTALIVALLAVAAFCATARAEQKTYEFRQNYKEQDQYAAVFSESMQLDVELRESDRVIDHRRLSETAQSKMTLKVVKAQKGVPTIEQLALDQTCGTITRKSGEPPRQFTSRLAGKTVTVSRDPLGAIQCDADGADDPRTVALLEQWLGRDTDYYPDHPVAIREKWDISRKLRPRLHLSSDEQAICVCRLKEVKDVRGHPVAEVSISTALIGTLEGVIHLEAQMEGAAFIDLTTGRVVKVDLAGDIRASGSGLMSTSDGRRANLAALGSGRIEYHQLCVPPSVLEKAGQQAARSGHDSTPKGGK